MKLHEQFRQKANERLASAQKIREKALLENRLMTSEENADVERLENEAKTFEAQAVAAEANSAQRESYTAGTGGVPVVVTERFEEDPMRGFKSPRDFMQQVIQAGRGGKVSDNLKSLAAGSDEQGTYDDVYGGFFVPTAMAPTMQIAPEEDPIAGRVQQVPMSAPVVKIPARVDKDHRTSVSGGFTVSRRAETEAATPTRAKFEMITLSADTLIGMAYATEELLTDSLVSFVAIIQSGFRDAFMFKTIKERLSGTGVGQFLGVLNSPCLITVDKEAQQAADTINGQNILKMRARCWGYGQAVWMANPDTYVQLAQAHIPGTNSDVFLFSPARSEDVPDMLLGRPVVFSEYAKTLGDPGDLTLGNWSQYLEGTLQPMQTASSIHVRFDRHEQAFKMTLRNAGGPWWNTTLTPAESATTLSPFVTLAAR